jgi:SAM-dependent methyltransferase
VSAPQRRIVGFHQDAERHWVADLECGHTQHVRHEPPLTNRPWVLSEAGRSSHLGTTLACRRCAEAAGAAVGTFKDYFSGVAASYARFRPRYPRELFADLASEAPGGALAWDCATGNGQAAVALADHFERVVATDASTAQLARATPHARVTYRVAREDDSGLHDGSVDLVTVAQALHWFDLRAFYAEARRVLKPGGVLAVWCYDLASVDPVVDARLRWFTYELLGPNRAPEPRHVIPGFPFEEQPFPEHVMRHELALEELGGLLDTWSALGRYRAVRGEDPLPAFLAELEPRWRPRGTRRLLTWALRGRLGRTAR